MMTVMILCVGTTPAVQRVMKFRRLELDAVNRAVLTRDGAAGKSVNVAKVLQVLGGRPLATGFLGGVRGESLRTILEGQGVDHEFVRVEAETRQCVTLLDEATGQTTELVEESTAVAGADAARLKAILERRIPQATAVVMSGTIVPGVEVDLYAWCTILAREAGVISVVDAQGAALLRALPAQPGLVKPNRTELAATVGRSLETEEQVLEGMKELGGRGAERVVVTAGPDAVLAWEEGSAWRITPPRVQALNPIGSGDAFTAGLVRRWVEGDDLGEACRWGSVCGAANALSLMAGEVSMADVERLRSEARVERI